ncbi:MAG: Flp pilus assembly complex ATPase component TadA [Candidatus Omnitrophica bacterium]|nr:Flp pilus assembly complex ATPase component TadA [Candidatus Omnitrophota bacterium]
MITDGKLLELLLQQKLIRNEQAEQAIKEVARTGQSIEGILVKSGVVNEEDLASAKASYLGVPYIDLTNYELDRSLVKLIPESDARKYGVIPLFTTGKTISVGMVDPQNIVALDHVRTITSYDAVDPVFISKAGFEKAFNVYYRAFGSVDDIVKSIEKEHTAAEGSAASEITEQTPVSKLVDSLFSRAIQFRASDIHIEPEETIVSVRYRVDGMLKQVTTFPSSVLPAVVSRVKILGGMDITETRKPQDGKIHTQLEGKDLDIRVSSFPTVFGENVVMRLLDKRAMVPNLLELGFSRNTLEVYTRLIGKPYGIILVTGPTGSGKTTTLYASLSKINTEDKNIVTIEDPVEFVIPRIRQTQVNVKAGITFAGGLRGFLRQDPDIMMVGEIRDRETVEIAIQAALTGHLVFSTLHTNDSSAALTRLVDMGVEPFLISSSVIGILAQRLVRLNCTKCQEPYAPPAAVLESVGISANSGLMRGKGCARCNQTGFMGRTGIYELMSMTEEIKVMVDERRSSSEIRKKAIDQGLRTLRQDGLEKALRGITTLEEVLRVTEIE